MNKLFTRIGVAFAGIAMAIGVGVAVGQSPRAVERVDATEETVTLTPSASGITAAAWGSGSYGSGALRTATVGDFTFHAHYATRNTNNQPQSGDTQGKYIQVQKNNANIYNVEALGSSIKSIVLTQTAAASWTMYAGNEMLFDDEETGTGKSPTTGEALTSPTAATVMTWDSTNLTKNFGTSNYTHFCLHVGGTATYISSIAITYNAGASDLVAPTNIQYSSTTQKVTWDAVSNATGYYFSSDNGASYSSKFTNPEYDVSGLADGNYSVKIKAAGDGGVNYNDSPAADFALAKAATPTYESVTVTKDAISGTYKGSAFIQCHATVNGTNNPSPDVTWSITSSNTFGTGTEIENIATIDQNGKVVFLDNTENDLYVWALAADGTTKGSTTVSASGLGYAPGTQQNPYTVADAKDHIDAVITGGEATGNDGNTYYAKGIVSEIVTAYSQQYGNISYNISADGTTSGTQLQAYRGKGVGGANFTAATDIQVGDVVLVCGQLKYYGSTYEFDANNQLVTLNRFVSLTIATAPTKTSYTDQESFDIAGAVINANFVNQANEASSINVTSSVTYTPSGTLTTDNTSVTFSYTWPDNNVTKTVNQTITVKSTAPYITLSTNTINGNSTDAFTVTATYENLKADPGFSWGTPTSNDGGTISGSVTASTGTSVAGTSTYSGTLTHGGTVTLTCGDGTTTKTITFNITQSSVTIVLDKNSVSVEEGRNDTVTATVTATGAYTNAVTWASNDTSVATVDQNGKITGVAVGTTKVTCTSNSLNSVVEEVSVTVTARNWAKFISIGVSDFTTTSYANNNRAHEVGDYEVTSNQVMQASSSIQFQKNAGYLYSSTLFRHNINMLKVVGSAISDLTVTFSASDQEGAAGTEGTSKTLGGATYYFPTMANAKYFHISQGNSTGKATSIEVFEETNAATEFGKLYLAAYTCDENGASAPNQVSGYWGSGNTIVDFYNALLSATKEALADAADNHTSSYGEDKLKEFGERYYWIVHNHGTNYDFMGRVNAGGFSLNPNTNGIEISDKSTSLTAVVVTIAAVSTLAIGGFFFLRKRKIG